MGLRVWARHAGDRVVGAGSGRHRVHQRTAKSVRLVGGLRSGGAGRAVGEGRRNNVQSVGRRERASVGRRQAGRNISNYNITNIIGVMLITVVRLRVIAILTSTSNTNIPRYIVIIIVLWILIAIIAIIILLVLVILIIMLINNDQNNTLEGGAPGRCRGSSSRTPPRRRCWRGRR